MKYLNNFNLVNKLKVTLVKEIILQAKGGFSYSYS